MSALTQKSSLLFAAAVLAAPFGALSAQQPEQQLPQVQQDQQVQQEQPQGEVLTTVSGSPPPISRA